MKNCENSHFLTLILYIKSVLDIIFIVVPIILIIILGIKVFKIVTSPEKAKEEAKAMLFKIIALICVFFVSVFVNVVLSMLDKQGVQETECWLRANSADIEKYKAIETAEKELKEAKRIETANKNREEAERYDQVRKEKVKENRQKIEEERAKKKQSGNVGAGSGGSGNCQGSYTGPKYNLSETEITQLSRMVYGEYGDDINGMKAVASHMANLYEIRKEAGYTGSKGLHEYITTCGWYATASDRFDSSYDNSNARQAVIDCIVNGQRTLPLYIDEFDWFPGDIVGASSLSDSNSYVPGVTQLRNVYGASGTYYCITTSSSGDSNIFFFTSEGESYKSSKGL